MGGGGFGKIKHGSEDFYMTVAVCLCDRGGMLFNNRRQSRDRVLLEYFMALCDGSRVLISDFSSKLFDA